MREVADAAGPYWSRMSKTERKPYEDKANFFKNNVKPAKFSSDGEDLQSVIYRDEMEVAQKHNMKEEINQILKIAAGNDRLEYETFFLIHVNIFCSANGRHYPAEIALAAFNLLEGVGPDDIFHRLVKPGPLPLGYAAEANIHSNQTHQISPPCGEDDEDNTRMVFNELLQFLTDKTPGSMKIPPLYADERSMKMIQQVLDNWCEDFDEQENLFKVYSLEYMFRVLKNTSANKIVWGSDTMSAREIEKDVYAYTVNIACELHQVVRPLYCSQSIVTRFVYIICDNCCPDLGIPLKHGYHIPLTMSTSGASSKSSKFSCTTKSSRTRSSTYRDSDTESMVSMDNNTDWETESVASTITNSNASDFPALGTYSQASTQSVGDRNSLSQKSYANAMSTAGFSRKQAAMPFSMTNFDSPRVCFFRVSKGRARPAGFQQNEGDFPTLGQGRGRGIRR